MEPRLRRIPGPSALVRALDTAFEGLGTAAAVAILVEFGSIVAILVESSLPTLHQFGFGFLVQSVWDPVHQIYGVLPFVTGTLLTSALALLIAVPLSLGVAIFLSELAPHLLRSILAPVIDLLAAVPSIVYGLWGFVVLVPIMRSTIEPSLRLYLGFLPIFGGAITGLDVLSASVILSIMVIPTISAVSRESMASVPTSQREAALALGATRWEATRTAVISYARAGIVGAIILGLGRALGETMAVTMTIGNSNSPVTSLFSQGQTIASLIANDFTEASQPLEFNALVEAALVLLLITLVVNIVARLLTRRVVRGGTSGRVD